MIVSPLAVLPALAAAAFSASAVMLGLRSRRRACGRGRLEEALRRRGERLEHRARDAQQRLDLDDARNHLQVSERLAAVGRLAAGVAHEINNPLAVTLTNLAWAREALPAMLAPRAEGVAGPSPEDLLAALADAEEASRRVAAIVRDLHDFAADGSNGLGSADLVSVLQHVQRLVAGQVRQRARLALSLPRGPVLVRGNASRLAQLFGHLLLHASGGIQPGKPQSNEILLQARRTDAGAEVEVRDTGQTLTPDELAHAFDPFYEGWPRGGGRGLGLGVCHGIVGSLGGELTVEALPEGGTLYRVRLTCPNDGSRLALPPAPLPVARPRVLVVDDEPLVCASLYRVLSPTFDVAPHTSPRHALALLRSGARFQAVLCDLAMPELSGMELHEEILRIDPALAGRTVFLTGGASAPGCREFLARVPNVRLQKPFDGRELVVALTAQCGTQQGAERA